MSFGPRPRGFWSEIGTPEPATSHSLLEAGRRYRVIRRFADYDGQVHEEGEEWTFLGCSFLPADDGMSFFVSLDGRQEWQIRLQWGADEQGNVLDDLGEYIAER